MHESAWVLVSLRHDPPNERSFWPYAQQRYPKSGWLRFDWSSRLIVESWFLIQASNPSEKHVADDTSSSGVYGRYAWSWLVMGRDAGHVWNVNGEQLWKIEGKNHPRWRDLSSSLLALLWPWKSRIHDWWRADGQIDESSQISLNQKLWPSLERVCV